MFIKSLLGFRPVGVLVRSYQLRRSLEIYARIRKYLNKNDRILDIGSGTCEVPALLIQKGFKVVPLDVKDISLVKGLLPIIYDGKKIPYKDNEFDVSLSVYVLHHIRNADDTLKEAIRVSKSLIIIEDIYYNPIQKYLTFAFDSLINLEFFGHPHKNKDDIGWRKTFKELGLKLKASDYFEFLGIFSCAAYYLQK